jgi:hypothetical protein
MDCTLLLAPYSGHNMAELNRLRIVTNSIASAAGCAATRPAARPAGCCL